MNDFVWTVRVRADQAQTVTVHARNLAFQVGEPLTYRPTDSLPSALEQLLAGLAADLIGTFRASARRRRISLDNLEMAVNCTLHDPLAHIGVVGESGDPSIKELFGVLYVSTDESHSAIESVWSETLQRAPIYRTLSRAADLRFRLEITV